MSSRTLVVATVMRSEENPTPIGRQLTASVVRLATPNASSSAASMARPPAAACCAGLQPEREPAAVPELVSTPARRRDRRQRGELMQREPIEGVGLGQNRAAAREGRSIGDRPRDRCPARRAACGTRGSRAPRRGRRRATRCQARPRTESSACRGLTMVSVRPELRLQSLEELLEDRECGRWRSRCRTRAGPSRTATTSP